MSKKNPQILSPDNYIRQRARNLSIHKCLINEEWEEMGLAYIFVFRKHTNGNITFCNYLIDLKCLGIKDTFYHFNILEWEFDEIVENIPVLDFIEVEYNLVHNIIHAAWEYAEELDFEPHKDFLSITRFMLEEDTDDIPLMEIKCGGKNDKPLYIQGETENDSQAKAILNHLEKKVGKGNFEFVMSGTEDWDDEDWDDEDWDDEEELFEQMHEKYEYYYELYEESDKEDNINSFLDFVENIESGLDSFEKYFTDISQLYALADVILNDILDEKRVEAWNKKWKDELKSIQHIETEITAKTIGLSKDQEFSTADSDYLNSDIDENAENKFIKKRWGETPLTLFRKILEMKTTKKKEQELDKALKKYPGYPLLRMLKFLAQIENESLIEPIFDFDYIFPNKKEVSPEEFAFFQILKFHYFRHNNDLEGTDSLFHYVEFLEENDDLPLNELSTLIFIERLFMISDYLKKTAGN